MSTSKAADEESPLPGNTSETTYASKPADAVPAPQKARGDSAHQRGGGVPLLGMLFKLVEPHRDRRVALGYDADAAVIIFSGGSLVSSVTAAARTSPCW